MNKALTWVKSTVNSILGGKPQDPYELIGNKAAIKRENGLDFPARDYAYVPDPEKPSSWKLRLTESPGKVSVAQLARAAAALSPGGFRGQRVEIPEAALSAVKRRVRAEYRKLGVVEAKIPTTLKSLPETSVQENSPFMLWKDAAGDYNFVAIYSNNMRDDDRPAEILTEKAHHDFVKGLELGVFDYPELWHWHLDGTRWGKANHVMVVDGFAIALGKIDKGHEAEAEAIANLPYPIAMSHGMPKRFIVRNKQDPTLIEHYVSTEISVLPKWAAANKWTGFVIVDHNKKEQNMPLSDEQLAHLQAVKLPQNVIDGLNGLGEIGKQAGRERKETTALEPTTGVETTEKSTVEFVTKQEVAESLGTLFSPILDALKQQNDLILQQGQALADMQAEMKEMRSTQSGTIAEQVGLTPSASIADLASARIFGQNSPARVNDTDPLKGKKPAETAAPKTVNTGVDFLDSLIERSYHPDANGVGG